MCFHASALNKKNIRYVVLTSTCYFHIGGFLYPLRVTAEAGTFLFNHGSDIDESNPTDVLYKEIDQFNPIVLLMGSHHLVLLSQQGPKDETLDLGSVLIAFPVGSTVPPNTHENLKKKFTNLSNTLNGYGMTESIGLGAVTISTDTKCLGGVQPGSIIKIVEMESGKVCGPNEVNTGFFYCQRLISRYTIYTHTPTINFQ